MAENTLVNGEKVKEGDLVAFINSDGERCESRIKARPDGSLYFWNAEYELKDYPSAFIVSACGGASSASLLNRWLGVLR